MKSTKERLLMVINILVWLVCIGIVTKAGSIIISYIVSFYNPQAAKDLYNGMDLYSYRIENFWDYTFLVVCKVLMYAAQAYIAYLVTRLLNRLNVSSLLSGDASVVKLMRRISYSVVGVWFVAMLYNIHTGFLEKVMELLQHI